MDERSLLLEYLRTQRLTLSMKCADLDADGFAVLSVPPSTMSLLGLVRHMAEVERNLGLATGDGSTARGSSPRHRRRPQRRLDRGGGLTMRWWHEAWVALREEQEFTDQFVASVAERQDHPSTR